MANQWQPNCQLKLTIAAGIFFYRDYYHQWIKWLDKNVKIEILLTLANCDLHQPVIGWTSPDWLIVN